MSNSLSVPARVPLAPSGEDRAANAIPYGAFAQPATTPSNLYPSIGPAALNSNSVSTARGFTAPGTTGAGCGGASVATMSAIPEPGHINGVKRNASEMDAHGSAPSPDAADHSAPVTTTAAAGTPGNARRTSKGKGAKDAEKEKEKKTRSKAACAGCKSVKQK